MEFLLMIYSFNSRQVSSIIVYYPLFLILWHFNVLVFVISFFILFDFYFLFILIVLI